MSSIEVQPDRTATAPARPAVAVRWQTWGLWLLALAMFGVGLWLRVAAGGQFVIEDEARYWIDRSYTFYDALERGDLGATAISTHPGVLTMWSGTTGIVVQNWLLAQGWLERASFPVTLALMRLPLMLAHALAVLVGFGLLRQLLPASVALLGALLWATDPLTIAYQRVLHVDGGAGTFATLSLLLACFYWLHTPRWWVVVLSGAAGAVAMLSKSVGVGVVPVVGAFALWQAFDAARAAVPAERTRAAVRQFAPVLLWGGGFGAALLLVYPAMWADPWRVYELMRVGVAVEGSSPHNLGNFFLGQRDDEPGVLFYPVAVALRLTPWAMVGLLLLPVGWRLVAPDARTRRTLAVLALFALVFIVALSIFPKKLNRYLMPIFPALNILAAAGIVWTVQAVGAWLAARVGAARGRGSVAGVAVALLLTATLAIGNALAYHPYSIVYFNQLLGGTPAGARTFLMGSGEGLEQVADWLNAQPDSTGVVTAATMTHPLQPYLASGVQSLPERNGELPASTGYVVVYIRNVWNGATPPFDRFWGVQPPLTVVSLHGVPHAWVYQVPPPTPQTSDAQFGDGLRLPGYGIERTADGLMLTTQWQTRTPPPTDYMLFVHVLARNGQRVAQIDAPPLGDTPTSAMQPGRYYTWQHPVPLPADLPPDALAAGDYWLALGLYDPATGARLPLQATPLGAGAPDGGGNALVVPLTLDTPAAPQDERSNGGTP